MNKYRIVIASVLKPVTEPRAFSKLALSMRETSKYHINIIGFCSKKSRKVEDIQLTPIFCRHRTHALRLFAQFKFLREIVDYKPNLVIVTTYELLPMALLGKAFLGFRLIYDLQENYSQNVQLNQSAPGILRFFLSALIKIVEKSAHRFIDHYFFAEQIYISQFPHIRNYTILENKYAGLPPAPPRPLSEHPVFVISGTITPAYGVEKAIHWFLSLQEHIPQAKLQIVGHVPLSPFHEKLKNLTSKQPQISLNISPNPLSHDVILEAVQQADVVLMPYETLESIRFKIPSKLYESMALRKPILISNNPLWEEIIQVYPAGLAVDFSKKEDAAEAFKALLRLPLYQVLPGEEVTWKGEREKLIAILSKLLP
jgi:glycosyltransferase involved in cell wall biosynthesis